MVFQDPEAALDPAFAVGEQVAETIRAHRPVSGREARKRATQLLTEVGIPAAAERYGDPPHRLSGGMQQRVVIATALAQRAGAARGGRADDGARRDDPGPDPGADPRAARSPPHHGDPDRARPRSGRAAVRPGGGALRRAARRGRAGRADLRRARASLHQGAARGASDTSHRPWGAAGRRRRSARSRRPAARLPVRAALPGAHGRLRARAGIHQPASRAMRPRAGTSRRSGSA